MPKHKLNAFFHVGGRHICWSKFCWFLERQTYPHKDIKLIVVNTTPQHQYYKKWLEQCDYEYAYEETKLNSPPHMRTNRLNEMCRNQVAILDKHVDAEYLWTLDDDIIPPDDVVYHLLPHFNTPNVMAVSACYRLAPRIQNRTGYCCWPIDHNPRYYTKSYGVQVVGGACWGCCLWKNKEDGKPAIFFGPQLGTPADVVIYRRVAEAKGVSKVNWDVECAHLADDGTCPYPVKRIPLL